MTLADLRATAEVLAGSDIVGVESGDLERAPDPHQPAPYVAALLYVLEPLLDGVGRPGPPLLAT